MLHSSQDGSGFCAGFDILMHDAVSGVQEEVIFAAVRCVRVCRGMSSVKYRGPQFARLSSNERVRDSGGEMILADRLDCAPFDMIRGSLPQWAALLVFRRTP